MVEDKPYVINSKSQGVANKRIAYIVIVDRDKYMEKMENFLSDESKFQKNAFKDNNFLNFITSQEKQNYHITDSQKHTI